MIDTVHLVYPHGDVSSCPDAIGRHLAEHLGEELQVVLHDWDSAEVIPATPSAALVGHAHPRRRTCFRLSAANVGWGRVILLEPFTTNPRQVGFLRRVVPRCDQFLAITGPWWANQVPKSRTRGWIPRLSYVDLAVDRSDFPVLRTESHAPAERRLVYLGGDSPYKNLGYLDEIAGSLGAGSVSWVGPGRWQPKHVVRRGHLDLRTPEARATMGEFDFLITVGHSDANPATILEAMAWGLVPIATPTSGYGGQDGVIELPLGDVSAAVDRIRGWLQVPGDVIGRLRSDNWHRLDSYFTWERFSDQVRQAILDERPRPPIEVLPRDAVALAWGEARHQTAMTIDAMWRLAHRRAGSLLARTHRPAHQIMGRSVDPADFNSDD